MTSIQSIFDDLSPHHQLLVLGFLLFFFFGIHNLLQEAIMALEGFKWGIMLGYFEVLGVTVCTHFERIYLGDNKEPRKAPPKAFFLLTFLLMSSSSLSNLSLNYINYPTKVVFRSCKLLPTMFIATIINNKVFGVKQYVAAGCICAGLVLYAAADWTLAPSFRPFGLVLVFLSICADSVLPNAQEKLFVSGSSRSEVTYYVNVLVLVAMTFSTLLSGDLLSTWAFASENPTAALYLTMYTVISYVAIGVHMNVINKFGGVTCVLLGTGRKAMTIMLSFIIFPKQFSWFYVFGSSLVLGGLTYSGLDKANNRNAPKMPKAKNSSPELREKSLNNNLNEDEEQPLCK